MAASTLERYRNAIRDGDFELALELEVRLGQRPDTQHRGRLSPLNCRRFLLSGNARVTAVDLSTGFRKTYRVRLHPKRPEYLVDVLFGPNNTRDYLAIGCMAADDGVFTYHPQPKQSPEGAAGFEKLHACLGLGSKLATPFFPRGFAVYHEGRCGRCALPLTVPESIEAGIGPECKSYMEQSGQWTRPGPITLPPPPESPKWPGLFEE